MRIAVNSQLGINKNLLRELWCGFKWENACKFRSSGEFSCNFIQCNTFVCFFIRSLGKKAIIFSSVTHSHHSLPLALHQQENRAKHASRKWEKRNYGGFERFIFYITIIISIVDNSFLFLTIIKIQRWNFFDAG